MFLIKSPKVCDELVRSGQLGPLGRCFFRCLVPQRGSAAPAPQGPPQAPQAVAGGAPLPGLLGNVQVDKKAWKHWTWNLETSSQEDIVQNQSNMIVYCGVWLCNKQQILRSRILRVTA